MLGKGRALGACVFVCLGGAAGSAQAQFLDLDLKTSRGAFAAGRPQVFTSTAPTKADGTPTAFGGAGVTYYSLEGFFSNGAPANGVALPASTPLSTVLANNRNARLIGGGAARSGELHVRLDSIAGAQDVNLDNVDGIGFGDCSANAIFNNNVGLPAGATVGSCDAVDATARLNGVTFRLTGGENQIPVRLEIPEIGYAFTSNVVGTPANPLANRADSLHQIRENLNDSGKADLLAARLLGKPDSFVLQSGVLPNEGNLITGSVTAGGVTKTFALDNPGQFLAYAIANRRASFHEFGFNNYSDSCLRVGAAVTGTCGALAATVRILGVTVTASAPAQSTDITFAAPDLDLSFTSSGAADRGSAAKDFASYARDNVDNAKLTSAYARYLAQNSPNDPLIGNPFSAQGQLTRANLDLDSPSQALGETGGKSKDGRSRDVDPSGWMVGGRAGYLNAGQSEASFVDANIERGFRIKEGSRMRLKVSLPLSYIDYGSTRGGDGGRTATVGLRTSLEVPVIADRWVVEPAASAAAFYSSNVVSSGALYAFGISSRYKLAPVGRGHIVIGNAITYSSTLHIEVGDDFSSPKIQNTALRNGIAYQVPYGRFLGRQGTLRASYTYTHLLGDDLFVDQYHEVSLSYGVAAREAAVKQIGETLRLGLSGALGKDFTAISLTAGYRF